MASTENRGLTARDAVLKYCTSWTQAVYRNCWPQPREVAPDATTEEKKAACLAAERELMAMLKHEAPASEPMRELAVLLTGDLGSDSEPDIMAGSFLGTYGKLDIDTAGHWTYRAGETRLREIKENGPDWFAHHDRFFVTREDGSVQTLTITLSRRRNDEVKETKAFPAVDARVPAEAFGENNEPDLRLAVERDLARKLPDPDPFDEPAPVPLWVAGQLGVNQPLVRLTFDDIRNTEFDIEENEAFGDGSKFVGLRFFNAETQSRVPSLSDGAPVTEAQKEGRPTYENEIQEAGQSLLDSGEINPATPWKRIADKVRKLVQESVGTRDNRGLDDQTIRRHLKPILDARGKARS